MLAEVGDALADNSFSWLETGRGARVNVIEAAAAAAAARSRRGTLSAALRLWRCYRRTEPFDFVSAHVASSARRPFRSFTKMQTDLPVPATRGVNKSANDVIALPSSFVFLRIAELLNKMRQ